MDFLIEESDRLHRPEPTSRRLGRWKGSMLGLSISFFALATLAIFQLEPIYRATALVTLDPAGPTDSDASSIPQPGASPALVGRALRSPELARRVITKLRLDTNAAFVEDLRPNPWMALLDLRRLLPEEWADVFLGPPADATQAHVDLTEPSTGGTGTTGEIPERLVRGFSEHVSATSASYPGTFGVSFESHDPVLAATAANAIADAYIVLRMESIDAAARSSGSAWAASHLADLHAQMAASRAVADAWRKEHSIAADIDAIAIAREVGALDAKLADAQKAREAAEARLQRLQAGASGNAPSDDLADAPSLHELLERRAELEQQRTELSARFGDLYPTMQKLQDEIDELGRRIAAEKAHILEAARADLRTARAAEDALEARIHAHRPDAALSHLAELERRVEADRAAYAEFLARSTEAAAVPAAPLTPDARIILPAAAPTEPAFPRKEILLPVAAMVSLACAALLVLAADAVQRRRRYRARRSAAVRSHAYPNHQVE
jgi:polysaccharide biosynthesis transport protein